MRRPHRNIKVPEVGLRLHRHREAEMTMDAAVVTASIVIAQTRIDLYSLLSMGQVFSNALKWTKFCCPRRRPRFVVQYFVSSMKVGVMMSTF